MSAKSNSEQTKNIPHTNLTDKIDAVLTEIVQNKRPNYIKGTLVDTYTASLLKTVLNKLNENNKKILLSKTTDEMVAIAYKMVTG